MHCVHTPTINLRGPIIVYFSSAVSLLNSDSIAFYLLFCINLLCGVYLIFVATAFKICQFRLVYGPMDKRKLNATGNIWKVLNSASRFLTKLSYLLFKFAPSLKTILSSPPINLGFIL